MYRGWGKPDQAAARTADLLRKAGLLVERPDDPDLLLAYGSLLCQVSRFKEAAVALRKAAQLNPDSAEAHHVLGHALGSLNRFPEAEAEFREAIRLRPTEAGFHHNCGDLFRRQKKYREAEVEYREAMRLDPTYAEPHLAGMLCHEHEAGDFERGAPVAKELIKRKPDSALL